MMYLGTYLGSLALERIGLQNKTSSSERPEMLTPWKLAFIRASQCLKMKCAHTSMRLPSFSQA